jgi:RimJ/RimL family protein N-acetyltransferase
MPLIAPAPFTTEHLLLRTADITDLRALHEVNALDEVTRYLPYGSWRSADDGIAWFERMQSLQDKGNTLQFVIADKTSNIAIGTFLLFNHDSDNARAEIGYVLGRAHWGKGYMHETLAVMLAWAFGTLMLHRLEATIDPRNERSARLLDSFGFEREGVQRERWHCKGEVQDSALYGLLRQHWKPA